VEFVLKVLFELPNADTKYASCVGSKQGITEAVLLDKDPILGWDVHTIGLETVEGLELTSFKKISPINYKLEKITTDVKRTSKLTRPLCKHT
jgi:hypothetical protein